MKIIRAKIIPVLVFILVFMQVDFNIDPISGNRDRISVKTPEAKAAVFNNGTVVYSDIKIPVTSNGGPLKTRTASTSNNTWSAEKTPTLATASSTIVHLKIKASPTRNEKLIAAQKIDGAMEVFKCTDSCLDASNFTL